MKKSFLILVAGALACASNATAYMVGPALSLDELANEADIIFKGTCVSSGTVIKDEWFEALSGFDSIETHFKVISVIKGEKSLEALQFRHYDLSTREGGFLMTYMPQSYHFEQGRTYLVFAKSAGAAGVFRQARAAHTCKDDQGSLECADAAPLTANDLKDLVWNELQRLLKSDQPRHVLYGIQQLDTMSHSLGNENGRNFYDSDSTKDFEHLKVLQAVAPLAKSENEDIAQQAIMVIGSRNPYMRENSIYDRLATVGADDATRTGQTNSGGTLYHAQLVSIADDRKRCGETRAVALQALGMVRDATVLGHLESWLKDSEPLVRSAASLLLADAPTKQSIALLPLVVEDPAAEVRVNAAYVIGMGRHAERVPTLSKMLKDPDAKVRRAASMSLLSFSPRDPAVAAVFEENLENKEFKPLFLNALAAEFIEPYLDAIVTVVKEKPSPTNWSGGTVPAFTAWKLLFQYLLARPAEELRSGKWDDQLDALENGYTTGSSEPTKIYAFYLRRGMEEGARKYRETVKKRVTYDMDLYFNRVDADPGSESL